MTPAPAPAPAPAGQGPDADPDYWYLHSHELECGQVFRLHDNSLVRLAGNVPGDATRMYVEQWDCGWFGYDATIEPSDLRGYPLSAEAVQALNDAAAAARDSLSLRAC